MSHPWMGVSAMPVPDSNPEVTMQYTPEMTGLTLYYAVRASFPGPGPGAYQYDYCVGGALYKFMHAFTGTAFPSQELLADTLMEANSTLSRFLATVYAYRIIHMNDFGEFEGAWASLKLALTHDDRSGNYTASTAAATVSE